MANNSKTPIPVGRAMFEKAVKKNPPSISFETLETYNKFREKINDKYVGGDEMSSTIRIIFLIVILLAIVGGYFGGFGKVLIFITKGVWGKIAAVIICYSLFIRLLYSISFIVHKRKIILG